jgi:hypothetical protein
VIFIVSKLLKRTTNDRNYEKQVTKDIVLVIAYLNVIKFGD